MVGTVHHDTPIKGYTAKKIMNVKQVLPKGITLHIKEGNYIFVSYIYVQIPSPFCLTYVSGDHLTESCLMENTPPQIQVLIQIMNPHSE